jgi:1,4-dihydroxy-2-naphthoyl-CoA synthase
MGICVTKKDREAADLQARDMLSNSPSSLRTIRALINLRKDRAAPVVSLAANSLYLRRLETHRRLESTCEDAREELSHSLVK